MDKSQNMRRGGASRFSHAKPQIMKQSGMDGNNNTVFSEKLKKERMRRLSVVGRVSSSKDNREMGCGGSDDEDALPPPTTSIGKKVKLPRKFFHDCNTVDHASVPRKLRSAMKKRNRESVSPPLPGEKQPDHGTVGVKLPRKDGMKKSRMKIQQRDSEGYSSLPSVVGPITKDEEEVVETLYALAVMFPSINKNNGMDGGSAKPKSSAFPEGESSKPAFEDSAAAEKEEGSTTADAANPSLLDASAQETVEVKCVIDPSQPDFPRNTKLHSELENAISRSDGQSMSLLSNGEPIDENPTRNDVICNVQSQLSLETGSKEPKHEEAAVCARKPEIAAAAFSSQHELQDTLKESKEGSALWPGLSSARSHCAGTQGPSLQSCGTNFPSWLSTAASATQTGSLNGGVLTEKDSRAAVARKNLWKRCSAHVYICHLIKVLQTAEKTGSSSPRQPTELTPNEGSKQGILLASNHLKGVRNCLNGAVSTACAAEQNPNEVRNAILLHRRLLQDQQQASTTSVLDTSQMQSFDFLSLSAGGGGVEATSSTNKAGNGLEPLTHLCNPYLQSLVQNHTIMPFSLPQNRFSSTPFTDHIPVSSSKQVQIQPPPYLSNPILGPPHLACTALPKQQQQQWIWTAQYKSMGLAASHIPNWRNDRPDPSSSSAVQHAQPIPQLSHTSLEVLGPKYAPFSHQQQLFAVASSLPAARAKKQYHHIPSGYEGNGASSYPETALPLELLCNEHL